MHNGGPAQSPQGGFANSSRGELSHEETRGDSADGFGEGRGRSRNAPVYVIRMICIVRAVWSIAANGQQRLDFRANRVFPSHRALGYLLAWLHYIIYKGCANPTVLICTFKCGV